MENKNKIDWLGGLTPQEFLNKYYELEYGEGPYAQIPFPYTYIGVSDAVQTFYNTIPNDENFTATERIGWLMDPASIKKEVSDYVWANIS